MQKTSLTIVIMLLAAAPVQAHDSSNGTPAILAPKDGATVTSPITVTVDWPEAHGAVHGGSTAHLHGAHLHLIVDAPLPKAGTTVPVDDRHLHLVQGESATTLSLLPGRHTLQLIRGGADHRAASHAAPSKKITITVE